MSRLEVRDLSVRRGGKTVVDKVSFGIESGAITALIGPNGAGKSSLVLALAGALPVTGGDVTLDGRVLTGRPPEMVRSAGLAAVPEGHHVLAGMSVDDNLQAAGFGLSTAEATASVAEVYGIFPELAERKSQIAGSMSGGQQQMLALGQALVAKPKFVLADEMSLGLAPLIVKRLMGVVAEIAARGTGVLLIEQFTNVALSLGQNAHVMTRGRLRYSGVPGPLIDDPSIMHRLYLA